MPHITQPLSRSANIDQIRIRRYRRSFLSGQIYFQRTCRTTAGVCDAVHWNSVALVSIKQEWVRYVGYNAGYFISSTVQRTQLIIDPRSSDVIDKKQNFTYCDVPFNPQVCLIAVADPGVRLAAPPISVTQLGRDTRFEWWLNVIEVRRRTVGSVGRPSHAAPVEKSTQLRTFDKVFWVTNISNGSWKLICLEIILHCDCCDIYAFNTFTYLLTHSLARSLTYFLT